MARRRIQLFVAGPSARAEQACEMLHEIVRDRLTNGLEVEVVDIHADPARALEHRVIATPTLLKDFGRPPHRICGDLARPEAVLAWLDLAREAED